MEDCIFCKINNHEIPSDIIYSNDDFFVIKDIQPKAEIHNLIISKKHISSLQKLSHDDNALLGNMILYAQNLATKYGLSEQGYKIEINTGPAGGQEIMHLHIHFLGGKSINKQ